MNLENYIKENENKLDIVIDLLELSILYNVNPFEMLYSNPDLFVDKFPYP